MPKIKYKEIRFRPATRELIAKSNAIIVDFGSRGYELTLRQLYYQLVSRDVIANKQTEYNRLGGIISDARLAGLIDWDAIVDRTRNLRGNSHWEEPSSVIRSAAYSFQIDKWESQPRRLEVWVEKDALIGVVDGVCSGLDVPCFSCRGYTSQSEMWRAAKRLQFWADRGQEPLIIHLGDHDPSGIHMSEDVLNRLEFFADQGIEVRRIALNRDQVDQYEPPPNPAKEADPRFLSYQDEHGSESWELDALDPDVISSLIRDEILNERDPDLWDEKVEIEDKGKALLEACHENWAKVAQFLETAL